MNFVYVAFELGDKMLTLSSMENLKIPCNREGRSKSVWQYAMSVGRISQNIKLVG